MNDVKLSGRLTRDPELKQTPNGVPVATFALAVDRKFNREEADFISGNISTIHAYNRRNVKEEDVPKYGKAVGTGTLIIGISLALAYLVTLWNESIPDAIVLPAITIGLAFILYGQIKYNHGIF